MGGYLHNTILNQISRTTSTLHLAIIDIFVKLVIFPSQKHIPWPNASRVHIILFQGEMRNSLIQIILDYVTMWSTGLWPSGYGLGLRVHQYPVTANDSGRLQKKS